MSACLGASFFCSCPTTVSSLHCGWSDPFITEKPSVASHYTDQNPDSSLCPVWSWLVSLASAQLWLCSPEGVAPAITLQLSTYCGLGLFLIQGLCPSSSLCLRCSFPRSSWGWLFSINFSAPVTSLESPFLTIPCETGPHSGSLFYLLYLKCFSELLVSVRLFKYLFSVCHHWARKWNQSLFGTHSFVGPLWGLQN